MIKMYIGFHVKYPLFLSGFNETWIFLQFFEISGIAESTQNVSKFVCLLLVT
jgi:hypothetical protein